MDQTGYQGYSRFVEDKVYKPQNSTVNVAYLEKRVEKLESDKQHTEQTLQNLVRMLERQNFGRHDKENIGFNTSHTQSNTSQSEYRLEKLERDINKLLYKPSSGYSSYTETPQAQNKDIDQINNQLSLLEKRMQNTEGALKRQAEDIAADITSLEKQIRGIQNTSTQDLNVSLHISRIAIRWFYF